MEIRPNHEDGSPHVPDWTTLAVVQDLEGIVFDVWCDCGQSGSFRLGLDPDTEMIQWYP